MRDTAFAFFLFAVLCVTVGIGLGLYMGIAHDFTLAPAHAHLNLVGWATLALFAVYYRLTPRAGASRLAVVHAAVALPGTALMVAGMVWLFLGGPEVLAILGSLLVAASMLIFLATVLRHGFGDSPAGAREPARRAGLGLPA